MRIKCCYDMLLIVPSCKILYRAIISKQYQIKTLFKKSKLFKSGLNNFFMILFGFQRILFIHSTLFFSHRNCFTSASCYIATWGILSAWSTLIMVDIYIGGVSDSFDQYELLKPNHSTSYLQMYWHMYVPIICNSVCVMNVLYSVWCVNRNEFVHAHVCTVDCEQQTNCQLTLFIT